MHGRRDGVPPYFAEHVRIADMWLARPGLAAATRRFLRNWRAREQLRLIVHRRRTGGWVKALRLAMEAERLDPLWIFRVTSVIAAQHHRRSEPGA
jgi:hypothetical protein